MPIIYLGLYLRTSSINLPASSNEPPFMPLCKTQPRFTKRYCACIFGLSTHKVCRCPFCRQKSGSLLHYLFTLTKHITTLWHYVLRLFSVVLAVIHSLPNARLSVRKYVALCCPDFPLVLRPHSRANATPVISQ